MGKVPATASKPDETNRRRLDQWLYYARLFKSRSLAAKIVRARKVRVDGTPVKKANTLIETQQVLTFPKANAIRIIRILDLGTRRGPAVEAATLYEDLTPPPLKDDHIDPRSTGMRERGAGRPTKKERRALHKIRPELD